MNKQLNIFEDFDYLKINQLTKEVKEEIKIRVKNTSQHIKKLDVYIKYFGWPSIHFSDFNESNYSNKETIYVTLGNIPLYCYIMQKIIENEELYNFKPEQLNNIQNDLTIHYTKIINEQFKGLEYLQTYCNTKSYEGPGNIYDKYREFRR